MATNISHWLKVHSSWFKNYIFAKKCILTADFPILHFVGPDLGPNCLQRLSADTKVATSWQRVKYRTTS